MHAILLAMKRAYWSAHTELDPMFETFDLTQSRFDMMFVINQFGTAPSQASIARELGIAPPVAARTLQALENHGVVTRTMCPFDRRRNLVKLTTKGLAIIGKAIACLREEGAADRIVARMLQPDLGRLDSIGISLYARVQVAKRAEACGSTPRANDSAPHLEAGPIEAYEEIAACERSLATSRRTCHDGAKLHYRWHPDD